MSLKIDQYSWQARAFPVYLTISPIVLTLAAVLPHGLDLSLGTTTAIVFVPLSFLARQIGADFGKNLEGNLWIQWGGPPTTRFLRHSNSEFNPITRAQVHAKLRKLGLNIPSREYEEHNPKAADSYWEFCTKELIRKTRNRKQFPLVFKGLLEYGFRRNMLGLKPLGLPLSIVALPACLWKVWDSWDNQEAISLAVVSAFLSSLLLITWIFWVRKRTVAISAKRYTHFLLEGALELD